MTSPHDTPTPAPRPEAYEEPIWPAVGPDPDAERDADDLEAWWARYRIECPDCDGCGWVEGGAALKTTCATCGGTGVVEDRTGMESTVGRPASSRVAEKHGEISPVSSATTSTPAPRPEALPAHVEREMHKLRRWANRLRGRYGVPIYLVGSALREDNPDPRDWDIRIMLPDDRFALAFGPVAEWRDEGCTGAWTRTRFRWSAQCVKDTEDFAAWVHLNGDVQIYPESHAVALYADKPRVRLDSFPDEDESAPRPEALPGGAIGCYGIAFTIGGGALLVDHDDEDAPVARFTSRDEAVRFWGAVRAALAAVERAS